MVRDKKSEIEELKSLWFHFKINWMINSAMRKQRKNIKKYCKKGIHKISSCWQKTTNHKGKKLEVRYLKCKFCESVFFAKPKDKEIYLKIQDQRKEGMRKFIQSVLHPTKKAIRKFNKRKVKEL